MRNERLVVMSSLVVIGMIVLAGMPACTGPSAREEARKARCAANLKQLGKAINQYLYTSPIKPSAPLHEAARTGNLEQVKLLLDSGVEVNTKDDYGRMPLYIAVMNGHRNIVEFLISKRADVNAATGIQAIPCGEFDLLTSNNWTPLHEAASAGQEDMAELLVSEGANVNAKDANGMTPLAVAEKNDHKDVAKFLKAHGGTE